MIKEPKERKRFLITQMSDLQERGLTECDIIIVTGDAYVDHPSYGTAVIGRVLEDAGFVIGVIAQPEWRSTRDFMRLGKPRLFFGITSGNTDSMIANFTANKKVRSTDEYAPGDQGGLRPDRAVLVYANRLRETFKDVPLIIGGIEASLRRFAHYDYWDNAVRRSIIIESRADILVYGMGEQAVLEIANRLAAGETMPEIDNVRGTVVVKKELPQTPTLQEIPACETVAADMDAYNLAFREMSRAMDPYLNETLVQRHDTRFVIQNPPPLPMATEDLDHIYELPYAYDAHPDYDEYGGIPGFETVRSSIISHRGCAGECAFCSLFFHQGRIVQSRSEASIMREVEALVKRPDFRGTITDIGGPTANMYGTTCKKWEKTGYCADKKCLTPAKCGSLTIAYDRMLALYRRIRALPGVKHVFIGSGFRFDLLLEPKADDLLREICNHHVSGLMKVAPEHCSNAVLEIMQKPHFKDYETFVEKFQDIAAAMEKKIFIVNYFISAHPGATLHDQLKLALYCAKRNIRPEQIQDFIPSPMTLATCIYYTGKHPFTGKPVYVAKEERERKMHRALIQYDNKANYPLIRAALEELDMLHVLPQLIKGSDHDRPFRRAPERKSYRSFDRKSQRSFDRPPERSAERKPYRSFDRSSQRSPEHAAERKPYRSFDRKSEHAAERKPYRSFDRSSQRSPEHAAERKPYRSFDRKSEHAAERKPYRSFDRSSQRSPEHATDRKPYRSFDRSSQRSPEHATDRKPYRSFNRSSQRSPEHATDRKPYRSFDRKSEHATDRKPYRSFNRSSQRSPEHATDRKPYRSFDRKSEHATDRKPYRSFNRSSQRSPEHATDRKPYRSFDRSSQRSPEHATERKPYRSFDRKPERSTDRKPYRSFDRKPERSDDRKPHRSFDRSSQRSPEHATDRKPYRSFDRKPERADDRKPHRSFDRSSQRSPHKSAFTQKKPVTKSNRRK